MTALSIHLPEKLASDSQEIAEQMGISRTQFIRQALAHEIENFYLARERDNMVKSFKLMNKHAGATKQLKEIEEEFGGTQLPKDEDEWWTTK